MRGLLNLDRGFFPSSNFYDFPQLDSVPVSVVGVDTWLPFPDRSKALVYHDTGVHFYCDDFTFDNLWNQPARYIEQFKNFRCIVQPDFSLYYNAPRAIQIYNKYRNHWLACYYAFHGITVIPNINPSTPDCFLWSLSGYPVHSVVAFSDIGSYRNIEERQILYAGFETMMEVLDPVQVLYFTRNKNNVPFGCIPIEVNFGGEKNG